jgi:fatty-acid desaturase
LSARAPSSLDQVLEPPRYGFEREGRFYRPTPTELLAEFFTRINVFASRKNWLALLGWGIVGVLGGFLALFLVRYFSWPRLAVGFIYSMVLLGTHGTVYLHRYSTHRAYRFRNRVWRFVCQNLVIKIVPEETYVVSHHVHHRLSERPGDPYNALGGWLYCFLADVNHQPIAKNLSESQYRRVVRLLDHTGVWTNSYAQYLRWGSLCHPGFAALSYGLNWLFWYAVFFAIGGHGLAVALFGMSAVWAVGVRTFNYEGHGRGKVRHQAGVDFHRGDLSINQLWPGYVAGEWHNNHHLYPRSARSGFLPYQLDLAWLFISLCRLLGGVTSCRDSKEPFLRDHYAPWAERRRDAEVPDLAQPSSRASAQH